MPNRPVLFWYYKRSETTSVSKKYPTGDSILESTAAIFEMYTLSMVMGAMKPEHKRPEDNRVVPTITVMLSGGAKNAVIRTKRSSSVQVIIGRIRSQQTSATLDIFQCLGERPDIVRRFSLISPKY